MERQNKYRVIVSARAADNTHIPMGIPAYFIVCLQIRIFTICIFIPLSPTLARNRKKPLTEGSFRSL